MALEAIDAEFDGGNIEILSIEGSKQNSHSKRQ